MSKASTFACAIVVGLALTGGLASAQTSVSFQLNGFAHNSWRILTNATWAQVYPATGTTTGDQTVSLNDGDYRFDLAYGGLLNGILFSVAGGSVSSADARVTAGGTTVSFNVTSVVIDPNGQFASTYRILDSTGAVQVAPFASGYRTIPLIDGNYRISTAPGGDLFFTVAGGSVSTSDTRVSVSGATLTFLPPGTTVSFSLNGFAHSSWRILTDAVWSQVYPASGTTTGDQNVPLADGTYRFDLVYGGVLNGIKFTVGSGAVSSADGRVTASGTTVSFNVTSVVIDPNGQFAGTYRILDSTGAVQVAPFASGYRTIPLIDGNYRISTAPGGDLFFTVAGGSVSTSDTRVSVSGATLTFLPPGTTVSFSLNGFAHSSWRILTDAVWSQVYPASGTTTGDQNVPLADGTYRFDVVYGGLLNGIKFTVGSGAVSSADGRVTASGTTVSFNVTSVVIDPNGEFASTYRILDSTGAVQVAPFASGYRTIPLIDGNYRISTAPGGDLFFAVAGGSASSSDSRVTVAGATITFIACTPCEDLVGAAATAVCAAFTSDLPTSLARARAVAEAEITALLDATLVCTPAPGNDCLAYLLEQLGF